MIRTSILAASAFLAAATALLVPAIAAPEAAATGKGLVVTGASISNGQLVITGTANRSGLRLSIKGTSFRTTSGTNGAFGFNVNFRPASCSLGLTTVQGTLNVPVAGCTTKGSKGTTGARGPSGPDGEEGATGADGAPGQVGPQGFQGPTGDAGPVGPQGPEGPQGFNGAKGADGAVGPKGDSGSFDGKIYFARVKANATLGVATRGTSVGRLGKGDYLVTFPADVSECSLMASDANTGISHSITAVPAVGFVFAGLPTQVEVQTFTSVFVVKTLVAPPLDDTDFHLIAFCTG